MFHQTDKQNGQTLIETIVAIFVLVTGLSAGVALAISSFGENSLIRDRIVATNLAREGVELVRRMRDTNWINGALSDCGDPLSGQLCYSTWLEGGTYDLKGTAQSGGEAYRLVFYPDTTGTTKWSLFVPSGANPNYQLYLEPGKGFTGYRFIPKIEGDATNFYRKIWIIGADTTPPFSKSSPLTLVRSVVWWHGKRCDNTLVDYTDGTDTPCKAIVEEFLTNWKNY